MTSGRSLVTGEVWASPHSGLPSGMPLTRREMLVALAFTSTWPPLAAAAARQTRTDDDLVWLDATAMSARLAARTLSAVELTDAYLRRIERINASLTAFVTVTADRARDDARRVDGADPEGSDGRHESPASRSRTRTSSRRPESAPPPVHGSTSSTCPSQDATIVARLAAAGTVLLGKSNTHELGGGVTTINPFFGTTRNPWDRTRVAGGSSGGSAAAVAADSARRPPAATRAAASAFQRRSAAASASSRRSDGSGLPACSAPHRPSITPGC